MMQKPIVPALQPAPNYLLSIETTLREDMDFFLHSATVKDLESVLDWILTAEDLKLWGGPLLTFPPQAERTWQEICAADQNTFSLIDQAGNLAGFGQTLQREPDTIHLGRIIVSPHLRSQGVGRILMEKLIEKAEVLYRPAGYTLNVYRDNEPAFKLYRSLGFTVVAENSEDKVCKMKWMADRD